MKLLPVLLLTLCIIFGCTKGDPAGPDDPDPDEHDQGEVESG